MQRILIHSYCDASESYVFLSKAKGAVSWTVSEGHGCCLQIFKGLHLEENSLFCIALA